MKDFVNTMLNLGLGTLIVTRDKAQAIARDLIKKGELKRDDADRFVKALIRHGEQAKTQVTEELTAAFRKTVAKFDFATKKEVNELKAEVARLKRLLRQARSG